MSKHTPGPWTEAKMGVIADEFKVEGFKRPFICTFMQEEHPSTPANKRLIAAAPDLLEVLQMIKRVTPVTHLTRRCYSAMERVITKANGE